MDNQTLYNCLTSGSVEYKDNGEVINRPPTSIMLHAARSLKQLADINQQNHQIIVNLQNTINNQLQHIENLQKAIIDGHAPTTPNISPPPPVRDGD